MDPSTGPSGWSTSDPERFTYKNMWIRVLLVYAYGVRPDEISGPGWIDSARYDIAAKVPAGASRKQVQLMLQNLLAERLKLTLHRGTKVVPLYELIVAKNGPKLTVSKGNTPPPGSGPPQLPPNTKIGVDTNGFPILPEGVGNASRIMNGHVFMTARGQPLSVVTNALEQGLGVDATGLPSLRVIDKTGLTGKYDFHFDFAQRQMEGAVPIDGQSDRGPSVFSAVQDQLGLKLELTKGPVEMLIVDHIEKVPTEN
jgi:uncharacterized protein (TIGR03435 family)